MKLEKIDSARKTDTVSKILSLLQGATLATNEIFDVFLSGYSESYQKMRRGIYSPKTRKKDWGDEYNKIQKLYTTLNRLKRDGFVEKTKKKGTRLSLWKITKRGSEKCERKANISEKNRYNKTDDDFLKIIIFDIPEIERRKRVWLREILKEFEFSMLQQSVWIGMRKLPEQFIFDLEEMKLVRYVHIFGIKKGGTISDVFKLP